MIDKLKTHKQIGKDVLCVLYKKNKTEVSGAFYEPTSQDWQHVDCEKCKVFKSLTRAATPKNRIDVPVLFSERYL